MLNGFQNPRMIKLIVIRGTVNYDDWGVSDEISLLVVYITNINLFKRRFIFGRRSIAQYKLISDSVSLFLMFGYKR
jgi:hypothetical protein